MTLDEVADGLYALPPEEFTAARGEAVAAARKAGDRELASRIGGLRRPTVGAWLVNLLSHQRPDLIGELLALGQAMRAAQRNLRGDELRELSTQRRAMVSALARESRALAVAAGRGVRAVLPLGEVENTLTAALADPEVAEEVRLGRLVKPVEYAGFGEQPRPQLRLLHGGAATPSARPPADDGASEDTRDLGRSGSEKGARVSKIADRRAGRRAAGRDAEEDAGRDAEEAEAEFEREAEAEHEAAKQRAAEREASRKAAAEQRRRQQAAHRELLAARTALAEAEARRTEAEKAVRDAKRRVEQALAAVQSATPE